MSDLIGEIRDRIIVLYKISESVALWDMISSFASFTFSGERFGRLIDLVIHLIYILLVCPEFTNTLAIRNGRHPIKNNQTNDNNSLIPNDIYAGPETNFLLVTGPNMVCILGFDLICINKTVWKVDVSSSNSTPSDHGSDWMLFTL